METKNSKITNRLFTGCMFILLALTSCEKPKEFVDPYPALCDRDINVSKLGDCGEVIDTSILILPKDMFHTYYNSSASFSLLTNIPNSCSRYNSSAVVKVYGKMNNEYRARVEEGEFDLSFWYDYNENDADLNCQTYYFELQASDTSSNMVVDEYATAFACKAKNVACVNPTAER